ncbi:T9SS C-terminal target domain-containing protein [bacterium]|nr:MAG: T9SS C-terminal target domain-containing protein [bacterium]
MKGVIFMLAAMLIASSQILIAENNPVPEYDFLTYPTTIMTSYYDYLPGGLNTYPIAHQTDNGDGTYLTFMAKENSTSNRMQYYGYLNSNGSVNSYGVMSYSNTMQGFGDINVHPAKGSPIASWIASWRELYSPICVIAYHDPLLIDPWPKGIIYSDLPDEYLCPQIHKGPSPLGDDWIRFYHVSYNAAPDPFDHPCEDMRILYIDIQNSPTIDLSQILYQANWTAVYPLYSWRDVSCRPSASFAIDYVNLGHVAIIGITQWMEGNMGLMPVDEGAFVWESFDYGESWLMQDLHSDGPGFNLYEVDNLPQFELPNGDIPDKLLTRPGGYHSTAVIDNEGNVHFPYLQEYTMEDSVGDSYYLTWFLSQAEFVWNGYEFMYRNVSAFPWMDTGGSGHDVPWGIDPATGDTLYQYTKAYYYYDYDSFPNSSMQAQSFSIDNEWMIQLWTDCTYHFFAMSGILGYDEYLNHPLLTISASKDNGETWSEPLYLTDVHNPNYNFSEQITVYPYTQKIIQDVDGSEGKFVIMYMDDNSFGSYIQGQGNNTGGQITECVIMIDFNLVSVDEEPVIHVIQMNNYPNPFNNSTKISFSCKQGFNQNTEVQIYNAKGQLVRSLPLTLETSQNGYTNWDGKDASGKNVTNGIYFYKLQGSVYSPAGKMLLTR